MEEEVFLENVSYEDWAKTATVAASVPYMLLVTLASYTHFLRRTRQTFPDLLGSCLLRC